MRRSHDIDVIMMTAPHDGGIPNMNIY